MLSGDAQASLKGKGCAQSCMYSKLRVLYRVPNATDMSNRYIVGATDRKVTNGGVPTTPSVCIHTTGLQNSVQGYKIRLQGSVQGYKVACTYTRYHTRLQGSLQVER